MSSKTLVKTALSLNAAFSGLSGLALLILAPTFAALLFTDVLAWAPVVLRLVGAGLLMFAAVLVLMALSVGTTRLHVNLVVLADLGWVAGTAAGLALFSSFISATGTVLLVLVAAVVGTFAILQLIGAKTLTPSLARVTYHQADGVLTAIVTRPVQASSEVVWSVMTDHPGYADVASNLSRVEVVSGDGEGMQRRCYANNGDSWGETCHLMQEGHKFGFTVHTDAADYPYPIAELQGLWAVEPIGKHAEFRIELKARPKGNAILRALFPIMARPSISTTLTALADAWADRMETEAQHARVSLAS
ncbi:MAG: SRPBCC family protein [Thalassovita sp.]